MLVGGIKLLRSTGTLIFRQSDTIFGKPTHIIAGDNQHYNIQVLEGVLGGTRGLRHQRTNMSSAQGKGSMKMAVSAHSHVMWNEA